MSKLIATTPTVCPHTAMLLSNMETNWEHVIPDALGGPAALGLVASKAANCSYGGGQGVDAKLVNDPYVRFLTVAAGVKTRSGPAVLALSGTYVEDGSPLDIRLSKDSFEAQFKVPVMLDNCGKPLALRRLSGTNSKKFNKAKACLEAKGLTLAEAVSEKTAHELLFRLALNNFSACQGISKIAYLFTAWLLGDEFINSQAGRLYRNIVNLVSKEPLDGLQRLMHFTRDAGIDVIADERVAHHLFPCETDEHLLMCHARHGEIVTIVKLFGCEELTYGFGLPILGMDLPEFVRIARVNAAAKSLEWLAL
jgi:hypothetical protein